MGYYWGDADERVDHVKRLNGVDALMLYSETPQIHMHTLKIGILDVSNMEQDFSFEIFREVAYQRLMAL